MKKLITFLFSMALISTGLAQNSINNGVSETWDFPEARQFDFWVGAWDVNLRAIQADNTWVDWKQSKAQIYRILDGRAILELWEEQGSLSPAQTIIGYSLRYYDSKQKKWILWLNWPGVNRSGSSSLSGTFRHQRGEFFSSRQLNDSTSLISRYTFSDVTPNSLRWDDAFSRDGGKTWTNNWIMEWTRTAEQPAAMTGKTIHTNRKGERCPGEKFKALENLVGTWTGSLEGAGDSGKAQPVVMENYWSLGGCSVMGFMEWGDDPATSSKSFALYTYNSYANKYEVGTLGNYEGSEYSAMYGDLTEGNTYTFNKTNQDTGQIEATYTMTFTDSDTLVLEKWAYRDFQKLKVVTGTLKRTK